MATKAKKVKTYKVIDTKGTQKESGLVRFKDLDAYGKQRAREDLAQGILYGYYDNPGKYSRTKYKATIEETVSWGGGEQDIIRAIRDYCYKSLDRELNKPVELFRQDGSSAGLIGVQDKEAMQEGVRGYYDPRDFSMESKPIFVIVREE